MAFQIQRVVFGNASHQATEPVDLLRKRGCNLFHKIVELICEMKSRTGEDNRRLQLRSQIKVFPFHSQLSQKLAERSLLGTRLCVVGYRVETDVVVSFTKAIKRIQAANRGVSLQNADVLFVVRQTHSCG